MKLIMVAGFTALFLVIQIGGAVAEGIAIAIEKPWARASILKSRPGAAYLTIRNTGTKPDRLINVTSPAADMVMIHESKIAGGVAQMPDRKEIEIAPGSQVIFRPGALHLMLMGLREKLRKGDALALTLKFEHSGKFKINAPILSPGALGLE